MDNHVVRTYVRTVWAEGLNPEQLAVAEHGRAPLVVVAGAGTGKTRALTARVGRLLEGGVAPDRILLLTFTRRAAEDMLARATRLAGGTTRRSPWGGTFHSVAFRLLRANAEAFGLSSVSVLDPADAAAVVDLLRDEFKLTGTSQRLPRSGTLVDAISRSVNTGRPLRDVLDLHYPWCVPHADGLTGLAQAFTARKRQRGQLDFDDLLLAWRAMLADPVLGASMRDMWDYVLVDEYQDVNQLQADIVAQLCPDGAGLTVVGDDAQAIYGFRGSDPGHLHRVDGQWPDSCVVTLHRNYRSSQRILDAANHVRPVDGARPVKLAGTRGDGARPRVVSCHDLAQEARTVVDAVLAAADDGTLLREQAVLMRASTHSDLLELELSARRVPFRKYGGLKFLEAAHVKDFIAALRVADNARDDVAWLRVLNLHKGVGRTSAGRIAETLSRDPVHGVDRDADAVALAPAPARMAVQATLTGLHDAARRRGTREQADGVATVLRPLITEHYDDADARLTDLGRLVDAAVHVRDLPTFVAELTLDPPASTGDLAGPPHLDEDFLVLSTVHSAKGLEWSRVHVIGLVDGAFPSDMALGTSGGVDEERRLFYVAVTRARDELSLYVPLRMPHRRRSSDDRHSYAPASRFLDGLETICETTEVAREVTEALPSAVSGRLSLPQLDDLWK